ncbi:MAG: ATP-binding protein [Cyclobacteriaceae bacterium]|nr:ATP-binding protein [Cyclobacteriaceae bacterium]
MPTHAYFGRMVEASRQRLPWWTWAVPPLLFALGSYVSIHYRYDAGVGSIYLPTVFSIVLLSWWGPWRVLPALYVNSFLFTRFWGVTVWWQWFVYPLAELTFAFFFWLLFLRLARGKYWVPDTKNLLLLGWLGLFGPTALNLLVLQNFFTAFGSQPYELFWIQFLRNWLGATTANVGVALIAFYWLTPWLHRHGLTTIPTQVSLPWPRRLGPWERLETLLLYTGIIALSIYLPFQQYWFVFGLVSLYISIRFGFGEVLICNLLIFLVTYIFPFAFTQRQMALFHHDSPIINIFLGNLLLAVFSALIGRVVSDLREVEVKLSNQNKELEQANQELDRFVYSVSHDLSAPLRSIQGLVNISKLDKDINNREEYLSKVEQSVNKLDLFIREILDYSRNNRMAVSVEPIALKALCLEVIENLRYIDNFQRIAFACDTLEEHVITADKLRLKIILNNILSNAIKFQRPHEPHPWVRVTCRQKDGRIQVLITDNGEGMHEEVLQKLFTMFYRGSTRTTGSGLGLYIAKEAAEKMGGTIAVVSEYGKGSTFAVELPLA